MSSQEVVVQASRLLPEISVQRKVAVQAGRPHHKLSESGGQK